MGFRDVFVSAACLGVLPVVLYLLVQIAVFGGARVVEPNPFILFGEIGFMCVLVALASMKLFKDVRAYGLQLGAKERWEREKREFYRNE